MVAVTETHWDISIETDVPDQLTARCGCGWFEVIEGTSAFSIKLARRKWDEHDCGGRALQLLQEAFPGAELVCKVCDGRIDALLPTVYCSPICAERDGHPL